MPSFMLNQIDLSRNINKCRNNPQSNYVDKCLPLLVDLPSMDLSPTPLLPRLICHVFFITINETSLLNHKQFNSII